MQASYAEHSLPGQDLRILEDEQGIGSERLRLLTETFSLGSAPTARWAKMNPETPTTIIAVSSVIRVAGDGRQRIVIGVGGGSATTAFIRISITTLRMRMATELAASRCRVIEVSAPLF